MEIRNYKESDIPQISLLYFNTIRKINSRDYSQEQIEAWVPGVPDEAFWKDRFSRKLVFVAEDRDTITGFAEFEISGHIDCFYVHHNYQGRGIGTALMNHIEEISRAENINRLYAEVSLTAKPFFEKKTFRLIEERNTEYRGVDFVIYLMDKYIARGREQEPGPELGI